MPGSPRTAWRDGVHCRLPPESLWSPRERAPHTQAARPATRGGGWAFALAPTPTQLARVVLTDAAQRSVLASGLLISDESTTAISERLATLHTLFGQNVLHDEDEWRMVLDADELDGDLQAFKDRIDVLVDDLRQSRRMPHVERIWLPGEQSHARRIEYRRDGIPISAPLLRSLDQLADDLRVKRLE